LTTNATSQDDIKSPRCDGDIEQDQPNNESYINEYGDDFADYIWDGPDDSDEEVEELLPLKNDFEKKWGVKFSKNGIIKFIEDLLELESPDNKKNTKNAKLWENKL